ncbi:MAG: hypothetical protein LBF75_11915 [Treponema sp.]|nr:hypothetical protein [Treponema sp.]
MQGMLIHLGEWPGLFAGPGLFYSKGRGLVKTPPSLLSRFSWGAYPV